MDNKPENDNPKISPRKDGPLRVEGPANFFDTRGTQIDPLRKKKGNIALCRCGSSRDKPFCDGNHRNTGFSSAKVTEGEQDHRTDYEGKEITVHDNRGICAHIGYCADELPEVFQVGAEPWIDPDGAPGEQIKEQASRCPSGALSHSVDGVEYWDAERPPAIQVVAEGPYFVTGGIELEDAERGQGASFEHYALCRCGHSKNKPFCDGKHKQANFADPGVF